MSKIVQAVNSMISSVEKISDVSKSGSEYFFKYNNKYIWGIYEKEEEYVLSFYPETENIEDLLYEANWENISAVIYSTYELKTKEAFESFQELYLKVKEKLFAVDIVLNDIIGTFEH